MAASPQCDALPANGVVPAPGSFKAALPIACGAVADNTRSVACREVLLNLGPDMAAGWEAFERVVEIVSAEPADADAGRARWRHYSNCPDLELIHQARASAV